MLSIPIHIIRFICNSMQKGTSPLVIAQCYNMGPGSKIDPLTMISDAKRVCDNLVSPCIALDRPLAQ
jgi:hypothetical protein